MSFDNWKKRQAGQKVITYLQPGLDDEGYYRKPITEPVLGANGKTNGQKRIIGWEPVAYFIERGMLRGVIGDRDMAANEVTDEGLWSWVCKNDISENLYRAVAERGEPWPDLQPLSPATTRAIEEGGSTRPVERVIERDDNKPPEVLPEVEHAEAIDNAVNAARDLKIEDEASAAILLGAKNRIAELRLAADKAGHAIYDPIFADYKAKQKPWPIMVEKAKQAETALNTRYLRWREAEKQKAAVAAAEVARLAREAEEANQRAADRAIARGEPEPAPEIMEVIEHLATPAPVAATYRAPGQRTAPKEVEKWHFDGVTDFAALYEAIKDEPATKAALTALAETLVKTGRDVPGVKRHWGLI